ncbi:stage II sporulation protein M [Cytobacillus firmus]|uniref:Stage II sporulation protein M n=2 Tax=Cytobacillus TaxID=2675230 RepID=A0A366JZG1_CYTFI|nr:MULTISPECIES: stage II sporulation protein M [Cytobacillus]RBP94387.1 stage II sporulation protein M [Cytobacillus firmus]TDX43134.1 stage II sporulation protein M [Cytobacillus oceanisediminis]WHY33872.1 stage II sporulation protein M [Cytobacillus firmus]
MGNLRNIIRDPFYISILLTTMIALLFFAMGFQSGLNEELSEADYKLSFFDLLFHNSFLSLLNILGMFTLGIFNLYALFVNAFDLGNILNDSIASSGFGYSMRKFLPHAIFELPSMIISLAMGFAPIFLIILKANNFISTRYTFWFFLKKVLFFSTIILILNICAAFMESFISANL